MRTWTRVWIAIVVVCAGLTVYEVPNTVHLWRFIRLMQKSRQTGSGKLDIPAIVTDKLVAADPEAGDMLRYCLQCYNDDANMEDLAVLVAKWPDNEFLLSELAEQLATAGGVDTKVALTLVDKLLELNGNNAHYRYMRGWILLMDQNRPGSLERALDQFESGHHLPEFYLPYSKYKQRLDELYEKAAFAWERPRFISFYQRLAKYIFRSGGLPDRLAGDNLHDLMVSVGRIADRVIENSDDSESLLAGSILLGPAEALRLEELDMSEAEAQESRLRLARSVALLHTFRQSPFLEITPAINTILIAVLTVSLFISAGYSLSAGPLAFLCAQLPFRRRESKVCKNIKPWLLSDAGLAAIVALLVLWELTRKRPGGELPAMMVFLAPIFIPWSIVLLHLIHPVNLARLRQPRFCLAALCSSMWFKGAVFWTAGSFDLSTPDLVPYALVLLGWSALCFLIWAEAAYQPDLFIAKHRAYAALAVDWVIILMALGVFGSLHKQLERSLDNRLSKYVPLPGATEQTYNRVILGQGLPTEPSEHGEREDIPKYFGYAASQEVERVIAERRAGGRPISDGRLRGMLRNCSRDVRPILLDALDDPNAYEVLVIRAEWGDRSVKEQLERIYQQRLTTFRQSDPESPPRDPSSLGNLLELAGTLARISDGAEAEERFAYLMKQVVARTCSFGTSPYLDDPRYTDRVMQPFWEALGELPPTRAATLIKSYLRQTWFVDLYADRGGAITLLTDLLAGGDRELAEEVVGALAVLPTTADEPAGESEQQRTIRLTRYRAKNTPHCLEAVFAYLTVESIPLLLEHLDSDNDQLRAFIVWRVTSLGYTWTDEQLAVLRKDGYWKVRMNALFACDADDLATGLEDENPLVRTVARLLIQSQAR